MKWVVNIKAPYHKYHLAWKVNPISENKPVEITDDDFEELILKAESITMVDFLAPWWGPCHTMAPALASFAADNTGNGTVFKLDFDSLSNH